MESIQLCIWYDWSLFSEFLFLKKKNLWKSGGLSILTIFFFSIWLSKIFCIKGQNNLPYLNFGRARAPQEFPFLPELPDPFAAYLAFVQA